MVKLEFSMAEKLPRRVGSIKNELVKKSREAALAAVQIFNNPNINFKTESYIVLMIIAWTYLLHAYFRNKKIEYRYYKDNGKKRVFDKTKYKAYKYWELGKCLSFAKSPIDKDTTNNLIFLIGLRHEIEHQMTTKIDNLLSPQFQACCLNYNDYIKKLFGNEQGIDKHLSFSLQFSSISPEQKTLLEKYPELPANIQGYIKDFEQSLSDDEFSNPHFSYRVIYVQKTANTKGQADQVIEFVKSDSPLAESINKTYAVIKEIEKKKYLPKQVVDLMINEGFKEFTIHKHTNLWKSMDAKNMSKSYGALVAGQHWHWYEKWIDEVRTYCQNNLRLHSL